MVVEPSLLTRFWGFATTVIGYWQFWVAVAFMIERSIERYFPNFAKRADSYLTPHHRRRLFIWIAAIAFLYANFRAYDDLSSKLQRLQADKAQLEGRDQMILAVESILGTTISAGEKLIADWRAADEKQFEADANAWATKADDFVMAAFGGGEEAMFRSDAGYIFYGDGSRRSGIRNWMDGRLRRLNDLLQRSGTIPIRKDFNAEKFR
jgi:hypothetical protein